MANRCSPRLLLSVPICTILLVFCQTLAAQSVDKFAPGPAGAAAPGPPDVRPKPLALTVDQALKKFGPAGRKCFVSRFERAGIVYPPKKSCLIYLKEENRLYLFAPDQKQKWIEIACYKLTSWAGTLGPKLKEGDMQMPEGFYKFTALDARTHLCLWINYPNSWDRAQAKLEHRSALGGDIQIHEGVYSTGCIVLDHPSMTELFVLAHDIGCENIELIMAPCNLATHEPTIDFGAQPRWLPKLYKQLKGSLTRFPISGGQPKI
jgi:hypothetical protein